MNGKDHSNRLMMSLWWGLEFKILVSLSKSLIIKETAYEIIAY